MEYEGNVRSWDEWLDLKKQGYTSVGGNFYCGYNNLTSLEGASEKVGGYFYCAWNKLTSLKGAPEKVGGDFNCYNNELTSLKGAPKEVGGDFYCSFNELTSLKGAPEEVGGDFYYDKDNLQMGISLSMFKKLIEQEIKKEVIKNGYKNN